MGQGTGLELGMADSPVNECHQVSSLEATCNKGVITKCYYIAQSNQQTLGAIVQQRADQP